MYDDFIKNGYVVYKNLIPDELVEIAQHISLKAREKIYHGKLVGKKRHNDRAYWEGLDMASKDYPELFNLYTSDFMFDIAKELLNTDEIYLFNDQITTKLPKDGFIFEEHSDNSLGPNPKLASQGFYNTITCCWVLDDFTSKNGAIDIKNKSTGKYNTLYPKTKDIIVWDGETLHKSGPNKSNKPRRTWLQIYSTTDVTKVKTKSKKFSTFYSQRFIKGNNTYPFKTKSIKINNGIKIPVIGLK